MRELREALDDVVAQGGPRIAPALGVLADTGHVCELFASRARRADPVRLPELDRQRADLAAP